MRFVHGSDVCTVQGRADISSETALEWVIAQLGGLSGAMSAITTEVGETRLKIADLYAEERYVGTITTGGGGEPIPGAGLLNQLHTDGVTVTWRRAGAIVDTATCASGAAGQLIRAFARYRPTPPPHLDAAGARLAAAAHAVHAELAATTVPLQTAEQHWFEINDPGRDGGAFRIAYPGALAFTSALAHLTDVTFTCTDIEAVTAGVLAPLLPQADAVEVVNAAPLALRGLIHVITTLDRGLLNAPGDPTLHLYETFLSAYDAAGRRATGTWYTPQPIVNLMARLTQDVLISRLGLEHGFADREVRVIDPATGTGAFLLAAAHAGTPTVGDEPSTRFIGFERQLTPAVVAAASAQAVAPGETIVVRTDTLTDPRTPSGAAIATHLQDPVTVVIGNPPWRDKARGDGGWIEQATLHQAAPIDAFREPGQGRFEYILHNLAAYFWRWSTWATFEAHPDHAHGVVCLVTTTSYINAAGYAGMRRYLRETCDEGWIINLTPEGQRPPPETAVFPRIQQPVAIGLFVRYRNHDATTPARIHYREVHGLREAKFNAMPAITLDDDGWTDTGSGWTDPFAPPAATEWTGMPRVGDLMPWHAVGVQANRTWVYAPEPSTLTSRWARLIGEKDAAYKGTLFKESYGAKLDQIKAPLPGYPRASHTMREETGACPKPVPVSYRSFDTQWVIPDSRVLHSPSADLWATQSRQQVFLTEQHVHPIKDGPALVAAAHVPDLDHFNGRGGRVLPLWRDAEATSANLTPGLTDHLQSALGVPVSPEDVLAYLMAVAAHPGYTQRYATMLLRDPAIRIPITADPGVWVDAVEVGRRVLRLHTFGKTSGPARLRGKNTPVVMQPIPATPIPDTMAYDPVTQVISIGEGRIGPVLPEVWGYAVGRLPVLQKWFTYRRANPPGRKGSPLDEIRATAWEQSRTDELLTLIHTLTMVVAEHAGQEQLLARVVAGPLVTADALRQAGVLPPPDTARKRIPRVQAPTLFD